MPNSKHTKFISFITTGGGGVLGQTNLSQRDWPTEELHAIAHTDTQITHSQCNLWTESVTIQPHFKQKSGKWEKLNLSMCAAICTDIKTEIYIYVTCQVLIVTCHLSTIV